MARLRLARRMRRRNREGPARELTPYYGPVRLGDQNGLNLQTIRIGCSFAQNVIPDSTGLVSIGFSDKDVDVCPAFSAYTGIYTEFRVVAWKLTFVPLWINNNGIQTPGTPSIGAWAAYHEDSYPLVSLNGVIQNPGYKVFHTGQRNTITVRLRGPQELAWQPTSALPKGRTTVALFVPSAWASTNIGTIFSDYTVEFRSRQ